MKSRKKAFCLILFAMSVKSSSPFEQVYEYFFILYFTDAEFLPTTSSSPSSIIRYGNSSYLFIHTKMKWEDARKNCKRDQFDLSSVLDPYSHSFLWLKILKYGVPIWIGLNSNVVRTSD